MSATVPPPKMPSARDGRLRLDYLDGIRGAAALYVVWLHAWGFVIARPDLGPMPGWFRGFAILKFGNYAVGIFIVLSGYCLMMPVARAGNWTLPKGFGDFLRRRCRRILPGYYGALGLSMLLVASPWLRTPTGNQWDVALPAFETPTVVSHLLLAHNWAESTHWKIDPPLWSVALEFQIYLLFALVLLPVGKRFGGFAAAALAIALGMVPLLWGATFAAPWYFGLFGLGMLAAEINFAPETRRGCAVIRRWSHRLVWPLAALVGAVAVLNKHSALRPLGDTFVGAVFALVLIATTDSVLRGRIPIVSRFFGTRPMHLLGGMSYSLYLIHYPLIASFYALTYRHFSALGGFALLMLVGVPLTLLVAWLFHLVLERPFLNYVPRRDGATRG